jgi:hypothetical protein
MTIPLAVLLGGAAAAKAGAGIAEGVGTRSAAKKILSPAEQAELDELERRRASGGLGLTEAQEAALRASQRSANAGALQDQQAAALQQASAMGAADGVDLRSIFLSRMAQEEAQLAAAQSQNEAVQQADAIARQEEQSRLAALRALRSQAAAMKAQGTAQIFSGGLAGVGEAASMGAQQAFAAEMQAAALGVPTDEDLLNSLLDPDDNPYTRMGLI